MVVHGYQNVIITVEHPSRGCVVRSTKICVVKERDVKGKRHVEGPGWYPGLKDQETLILTHQEWDRQRRVRPSSRDTLVPREGERKKGPGRCVTKFRRVRTRSTGSRYYDGKIT